MLSRKSTATVATIAIGVGSLIAVAPTPSAAAAPVTTVTPYQVNCRVDGVTDFNESYNDAPEMTAPATVSPGETFDIIMQSGSITQKKWSLGRLSYDFKVPTGGEVLSWEMLPATSSGLINEDPQVIRINDTGTQDPNGDFLRVVGTSNLTIINGPNSNDNDPEKGLRVAANGTWQSPKIKVTVKAPATIGAEITTGLRLGAESPVIKGQNNTYTFGEKRGFFDGGTTASYCTATGAGRGALSTTTVAQTSTSVSLDVPDSTGVGQEVRLTANVSPNSANGTVQFKDGDDSIGSPVTVDDGVAALDHTFTTRGNHAITAVFNGGAAFADATSAVKTIAVKSASTVTLTAPNSVDVGDSVSFTADIDPEDATGSVQFTDGATNLGAPVPVVDGKATITHTFDEAGTHEIKANFNGSGHFADAQSQAKTVTVKDADFSTTAVVIDPLSAVVGESANLAATVRPIPDAGQVEFFVNGDSVGSAAVGTGNGVAVLPHTFTAAGTATITAKYNGAPGFAASNASAPFTVTVTNPDNRVDTSTTLSVAGAPNVGKTATFTARVNPSAAGGKVQFKVGTTEVGAPVDVVNGVATYTHTFTNEGTFAITAEYLGDDEHRASASGPTIVKVDVENPVEPGGSGSLGNLFGSS